MKYWKKNLYLLRSLRQKASTLKKLSVTCLAGDQKSDETKLAMKNTKKKPLFSCEALPLPNNHRCDFNAIFNAAIVKCWRDSLSKPYHSRGTGMKSGQGQGYVLNKYISEN